MAVQDLGEHHPAVRLRGIEVRQGNRTVLSVPEFALGTREVLALMGPNGAGKSTLLQVAALLRRPDQGQVWIGDEPATRRSGCDLRRQIGMVFQSPLLFDVGVLGNVASGLRFHGVDRQEAQRRARAWLTRFGVGHLAERSVRELSGGEAQRVSLARAFAVEPRVLLLDEPFASLDPPTRAALVPELIERLRETGTAAVAVTHDYAEALTLGDRLGVMFGGRIVQLESPLAVAARPASGAVATFLGSENVLPARIVSVAGTTVEVALEPSGQRAAVAVSGHRWHPGQSVALVIPAAQLTLCPVGVALPAGWAAIPGIVVGVTRLPLGQRVVVAGAIRLVAAVPRSEAGDPFAPGQTVVVGFAPDAVHLVCDDG